MSSNLKTLERVIAQLMKFPGIGRRSAERIAFYILNSSEAQARELCDSILKLKQFVRFCKVCGNLSESDVCSICEDSQRERQIICVVEEPKDLLAIEKTGIFHGLYHVLMGSIAPLEGRGPDDLRIKELLERIKRENIKEIIIATDSDTEGETTALYLTKMIKPLGLKVSRIGLGLPVGSSLDYADLSTLTKSLESRREI